MFYAFLQQTKKTFLLFREQEPFLCRHPHQSSCPTGFHRNSVSVRTLRIPLASLRMSYGGLENDFLLIFTKSTSFFTVRNIANRLVSKLQYNKKVLLSFKKIYEIELFLNPGEWGKNWRKNILENGSFCPCLQDSRTTQGGQCPSRHDRKTNKYSQFFQ